MVIKDIQRFSDTRYNLFSRNLPNHLPGVSLASIKSGFEKISREIENFDAFYVLDENGIQLENAISLNKKYEVGEGEDRSN